MQRKNSHKTWKLFGGTDFLCYLCTVNEDYLLKRFKI